MIYEFNHVGTFVRDLDASMDFYINALGGQVVEHGVIEAIRTDCIYVQIAGGMVELIFRPDPPADWAFGLNHLGFLTDDLEGDYQRLARRGCVFSTPPKPAGTGNGSLAMTADPNGVRIELLQRRADFRIPTIIGGVAQGIDHVAVLARDLERSELFYSTALGLPELLERRKYSPQTDSSAVYFGFGNDVLELLHGPAHEEGGSLLRHVALRVDDLDVASEVLGARGVQVTSAQAPPGRGRLAVVRDPDGVLIELLEPSRLT